MAKKKSDKIDLKQWVSTHGTDFVIKVRGGKPYVARKPKRDKTRVKSPDEQKQVDLFKQAVQFAKDTVADKDRADQYREAAEKEGRSIYHHAISDYLRRHREFAEKKRLPLSGIEAARMGEHLFLKIALTEPMPLKNFEVSLFELGTRPAEKGMAEQATVDSWWYIVRNEGITDLTYRVKVEAEHKDTGEFYEAQWVSV